jgi:hypothetical protein
MCSASPYSESFRNLPFIPSHSAMLRVILVLASVGLVDSFIHSLTRWGSSFNAPCFGIASKKDGRDNRLKVCWSSAVSTSDPGLLTEANGTLSFGDCKFLSGIHSDVTINQTESRVMFLEVDSRKEHNFLDLPLGNLNCDRFLACVRQKLWWMVPNWGSCAGDLSCETQFLLLRLKPPVNSSDSAREPAYAVILPLVSGAFRASLHGPSNVKDKDTLHMHLSRCRPLQSTHIVGSDYELRSV